MNETEALVTIQKIFESAAKENSILYEAYRRWNDTSYSGNDEAYNALVKIIHPKGGICIGVPLSYSNEINFWRACEVINGMLRNGEIVRNWDFVKFIFENESEAKIFLTSYYRESYRERALSGVRSLFFILSTPPQK